MIVRGKTIAYMGHHKISLCSYCEYLALNPNLEIEIQHLIQSLCTWALQKNIIEPTGATQFFQRHPYTQALHGLQEFYFEIWVK